MAGVAWPPGPVAVNPPDFASHWARELGSSLETLQRLRGGINNQVFRCGSHDRYWVIKGYPTHQLGQRDRMQAEVDFLRYANLAAPGRVPRLIHVDADRRCVVLEHIAGTAYPEGVSPPAEDVRAAVEFFRELNADLGLARYMIHLDAAEGFLSLRQHMANVRDRLASMGTEHLPEEFRPEVAALLEDLQRQADRVGTDLEAKISSGLLEDELDPEQRCVSPSDFGFHNAIRTDQGVTFIDFEFAGWDDPAKAICDFMLQPRVPIERTHPILLSIHGSFKGDILQARAEILAPVLEVKWICIFLSILRKERLTQILNQQSGITRFELIQDRLMKARLWLTKTNRIKVSFAP